jgi:hypothetical protein
VRGNGWRFTQRGAAKQSDRIMKCPHCKHEFPLTWKRYWSAWTWKHTCPKCKHKSQLDFPALYLGFFVASFLVGLASARTLSVAIFPGQYHSDAARGFRLAFYVTFILLVFTPLDKWFHANVRQLVKR